MQAIPLRIVLILTMLSLFNPSSLLAATEQRTALVIGNGAYSSGPLKNPVNDASDMAAALQKLGFKVILKKNANLETMEESIEDFGNRLKRGGVGLFYYAGHGVQVNGVNYLIPIGAKVNKESDVRYRAVDAGRILDEMATANNSLNIVLLDACRDNPFGKSFRSASRGLAIVSSAPNGTFISYSTSPGQVARDGDGHNSPYTKALLQYMQEPGIPITDVFMNVRQKLRKETGQVPWELSSLEGKFYFNSGKASKIAATVTETTTKVDETRVPSVDLDDEQFKIEAEREKLRKEKELLEQKEALAEEKQKLEEKKKQIAMKKRPSVSTGVVELDSIDSLKIINYVPSQKSDNFKMNLRTDLKIDTWRWDKIPYYMTLSSKEVILKSPKRIILAGDSQGRMPWEVDNFLLLETLDSSGTILKRVVIGIHDDVSFDGKVIEKIGPQSFSFKAGTIDVTHLFPINQQITLRASAMDYGGLGNVSNIFLIITDE